ncbi:MAG: type II CAAX endopeptidase family protein [Planctomycetota bacterium]
MDQPEETTEQTADEVFLTAVVFESALGVLALILGWALGPDPRALVPELNLEQWWPIASGLMYGALAAVPILVIIEGVRRIPWEPIRELERLSDDPMIGTLLSLRPVELILISICAGIGEELLFRGWMLNWFAGVGGTTEPSQFEFGLAVVGSSIAFGLMHPITKTYVVLAALMGVYFGVLLLWTENLLIPIAAHATYDAVQLIWTARQQDEPEPTSD